MKIDTYFPDAIERVAERLAICEDPLERMGWEGVISHLHKAKTSKIKATKQGFNEVLVVDLADGTQVLNTTTETIIVPDYVFAANDPHIYPGATFRNTCYFDTSTVVTTPGTVTFRQRWGGVAGTVLAASKAIVPSTTARVNFSGRLESLTTWRTIGATGTAFCMGFVLFDAGVVGADAAPPYYLMGSAGADIPAVVSSLDTTTAKNFSTTVTFSVSTATTQLTNHLRILECVN